MNKTYKDILKAINQYETIVVLRHEAPDFDASGSQFGLVTFLKDNYPNKKIYALGTPHKIFSPKLYPATDTLNEPLNDYLCIVVDVANKPRIDGKEYLEKASKIIKIDHHPMCDEFGDIVYVDEHASAAAEIISDILIASKKYISKECAYYLYSGIVGDSGRFQYSDTNSKTFEISAKLFKTGFDFQDIYNKMYVRSITDLNIIKYIYEIVKVTPKGVAYYVVDDQKIKEFNIYREQVKAFVNLFSGYEEIKIWVQVTEDVEVTDEYKWRVSIRSRGVKINDVASMFNGGGHDNASGAKCKSLEEIDQLIEALDKLL